MTFRSVPDSSFNSILRRSLVIVLKGRFVAEDALKNLRLPPGVSSAAQIGYFQTESDLPSFLQSRAAGGAALRILSGFAGQYNH